MTCLPSKLKKDTVFYSSHKVNYMNVIRESHNVTVRKHRLRDEKKRILDLDIDPESREGRRVKQYLMSRKTERSSRGDSSRDINGSYFL
jgi:hypothetical protein